MDSCLGRSVSLHSSPGLRAPLLFPCSCGRTLTQEKRLSIAEAPGSSSFLGEILVHRLHIDLKAPPRAAPKLQNPVLAHETGFVKTGTKNRSKFKGKFRRFNFQSQGGDKVIAKVNKEESCYMVKIEVSPIHDYESLYMRWGLFRSSSSNAVVLDMQSIPQGTVKEGEVLLSQLRRLEAGIHYLEFDLPSSYSPVFLTFSLYHLSDSKQVWIRNVKSSDFLFPVGFGRGETEPLGLTAQTGGSLNFSLYSRNAQNVILCLYKAGCTQPSMELELQSSVNRTGHIWHVELDDVDAFDRYGYLCEGESSWERGSRFHSRRILLDPYAKTLAPFIAGQDSLPLPAPILGILTKHESQFDWEDDIHPNIALEKIVAYHVHVTGFTAGKSSGLEKDLMGTFDGLLQKLQHFKNLGVNAIVLQPIFAFQKRNSYDPLSFFAPMDVFGPLKTSVSSSLSMKRMVKELHKNGIEVILDVVYTHTGEGNDEEPNIVSFRGIDNATYYVLNESSRVVGSDAGASNRFNCNHPVVHSMILDSLRHWVTEYHVDGFCFANASALTRGPHDEELTRPLLIEAISFDPLLSRRKLFADCSFLSKRVDKDSSFPHWKRWCLWNSKYRDDVRQFIRGDKGQLSRFATRLCGSGDILADGRGPSFSLNHVTGPFGLTLVDLVSYSANIDGDLERSWNCGEEGRTVNQKILRLRVKQVRNFLMCLFLSQGIPVLNMGDENGLTKGGSVSIDQRKAFNWDALNLEYGRQVTHLIALLAAFRERRNDLFQRTEFLKLENIKWHGVQVNEPDWKSADSAFLAVTLQPERNTIKSPDALGDVYIAFNSEATSVSAFLPEPPAGMGWYRIADTSLPYPDCFVEDGVPIERSKDNSRSAGSYEVQSHSSVLLEARSLLSNC